MDKSRKVILASCLCISFLAGIFACSVEETNLEQKGLFVCKTQPGCMGEDGICSAQITDCDVKQRCAATADNSCLAGSVCIAVDPDNNEGRCVLIDQVEHCHDNDGDSYYGADPGFEDTCGFTSAVPQDCDDANDMINAKATEFCDGVDNTCDGCVDGTCPAGEDCYTSPNLCKPLVTLCFGVGSAENMLNISNAVCSPKIGGVMFCDATTGGKEVFAYCDDNACNSSASYKTVEGQTKCPELSGEGEGTFKSHDGKEYRYVLDEKSTSTSDIGICDSFDNDCNGVTDCNGVDGCGCPQKCVVPKEARCYASTELVSTVRTNNGYDEDMYKGLPESCKGMLTCPNTEGKPVCTNGSGEVKAAATCVVKD